MPKKNPPPRASAGTPEAEPLPKDFAKESATEDYASSLNRVLESFYLAMADAFTAANVDFTPTIYEKILPEQVLILAAHLDLIPATEDSSENYDVAVGRWFISAKDRDDILESLASVIGLVRFDANQTPEPWKSPTPPEVIDRFLDRKRWKDVDLKRALAGKELTQLEAWDQFIKRRRKEPTNYLEVKRLTESTRERIKKLRDLMADLVPDEFGDLPVEHLWWRPINE